MSVSPTLWLSFHPPAQAFHSDEVYPLFLLPVLLVSYQINHCQIQCHEDFSLFSSKSFMVLVLKFRSLFHFELILEYSVRKGPNFMLLHVEIQFSYHRLLKRRSFPPRGGPGALAEARVIYCGFILGSVLVRGLRVCSVPVPRKSSRCDLLLPRLFGMFRVLWESTRILGCAFLYLWKTALGFWRACIDPVGGAGWYWHLNNIKSSNPRTRVCFHSLVSSLTSFGNVW